MDGRETIVLDIECVNMQHLLCWDVNGQVSY